MSEINRKGDLGDVESQGDVSKTLPELLGERHYGKFILRQNLTLPDPFTKETVHFYDGEIIYITFFHTEETETTDPEENFYCIHRDPGLAAPLMVEDENLKIFAEEIYRE